MSYRTITVSVKSLKNAERIITFAAMVARKSNAHLIGVHTMGTREVYSDLMSAVSVPQMAVFHEGQKEVSAQIKEVFDRITDKEDFAAEWREVDLLHEGSDSPILTDWLGSDLIIIGQSNPDNDRPDQRSLVERAVRGSGRPVLVLPYIGNFDTVGENILLGWSATRESARAAHDAMPLIKDAKDTKIFWVGKQGAQSQRVEQSANELAVALDRHGARVSILHADPGKISIGDELLNEATNSGSDMIVTGGFGHSRMYDFVLGATTNHLLKYMTVPVLLSH
jgi:nucleotide-binding universal stress UspA family protein